MPWWTISDASIRLYQLLTIGWRVSYGFVWKAKAKTTCNAEICQVWENANLYGDSVACNGIYPRNLCCSKMLMAFIINFESRHCECKWLWNHCQYTHIHMRTIWGAGREEASHKHTHTFIYIYIDIRRWILQIHGNMDIIPLESWYTYFPIAGLNIACIFAKFRFAPHTSDAKLILILIMLCNVIYSSLLHLHTYNVFHSWSLCVSNSVSIGAHSPSLAYKKFYLVVFIAIVISLHAILKCKVKP